MSHGFITVLLPFDPARAARVNAELDRLGNFAVKEARETLDELNCVHFMSMTAVCESGDATGYLVLEASVDGSPQAALARIADDFGGSLRIVLAAADLAVPATPQAFARYLEKHRHELGTGRHDTLGLAFAGTPEMSVERIRFESCLSARIRDWLGKNDVPGSTALQKLQSVRNMVFAEAALKGGLIAQPVPITDHPAPISPWAILSSFMLLLWPLALAPVTCVLLAAWWVADLSSGTGNLPQAGMGTLWGASVGALLGLLAVRAGLGYVRATVWGAIAGGFVGAVLSGLTATFANIELGARLGMLVAVLFGACYLRSALGTLASGLVGLLLGAILGTAFGAVPGSMQGAVWGLLSGSALAGAAALMGLRTLHGIGVSAVFGAIAGGTLGAIAGAVLHPPPATLSWSGIATWSASVLNGELLEGWFGAVSWRSNIAWAWGGTLLCAAVSALRARRSLKKAPQALLVSIAVAPLGFAAGCVIGEAAQALLASDSTRPGWHVIWGAVLSALLGLSLLAAISARKAVALSASVGALLGLFGAAAGSIALLAFTAFLSLLAGFFGAIAGATLFAAEFTAVALLLAVAYAVLRVSEEVDTPIDREPDVSAVRELMRRENQFAQNHLASVSTIKAGPVRRLTLRLVFWFIGEFGRYLYPPGYLSGIGSIHFARWVVPPGSNKLLFFSNYDGSWESYLEDFIARAHGGLSAIWSNTVDFPRTRSLIYDGASDGERFKRWARRQQRPTRFWYSAYPDLTTARIRANALVCHGLSAASTEADAAAWLRLMEYRAPSTVEAQEVPTLVFGGLKALTHSRCLVLALPEDRKACGRWLKAIAPRIKYGEERPQGQAVVLGMAQSGLRKLGLEAALDSFPAAFHQGMADADRARALGDVGNDDPQSWLWGSLANPADAVLLAYAEGEDALKQLCDDLKAGLPDGCRLACEIALATLAEKKGPAMTEPFGFRDGISQPILRGSQKWVSQRDSMHIVEPGEMVLGYADNLGYVTPLPLHNGVDVGRNGTYLVVRQLEQDKARFDAFLTQQAELLKTALTKSDPRVPSPSVLDPADLEEWVAAKMVGRWRDGTSLVRHPARPGIRSKAVEYPDNDFLFGAEDPDGIFCPFGAHVRRANPRESFEPGSKVQIAITNRHRIFRVGRSYEPQNLPQERLDKPGLLFMCVNADIEGQFEFLQQTWILGSSFHGLSDEIDPAVGYRPNRREGETFTIPTEKGPLRLRGLQDFVRVRGGGYFFMPSRRTLAYLTDVALGCAAGAGAPGY